MSNVATYNLPIGKSFTVRANNGAVTVRIAFPDAGFARVTLIAGQEIEVKSDKTVIDIYLASATPAGVLTLAHNDGGA